MSTVMIELQPVRSAPSWAAAPRPARPGREVYVRRRLGVALVVCCVLAIAGLSARSWPDSPGGTPASAPGRVPAAAGAAPAAAAAVAFTYLVQPGDTLWSIGERLVGDGDVARVVHQLTELNGDDPLVVGEELALPR